LSEELIIIIGFIATGLTTGSSLPQVIKTLKTRKTDDISLPMYCLLVTGLFFWLGYGILLEQLPIIIGNFIGLILNIPILIIVISNNIRKKKDRWAISQIPIIFGEEEKEEKE